MYALLFRRAFLLGVDLSNRNENSSNWNTHGSRILKIAAAVLLCLQNSMPIFHFNRKEIEENDYIKSSSKTNGYTLKKKELHSEVKLFRNLAENEGFEPPVPCGTLVFKTSAFDHSAISPMRSC